MTGTLEKEINSLKRRMHVLNNPHKLFWSAEKFISKTYMFDIIKDHQMSDEFLRHYMEKGRIDGYDLDILAGVQFLTESFIRDYQDGLDWMRVCIKQHLSESFMMEMENRVLWNYAAENQVMSEQFILDNAHRLNYYCLVKNRVGVKLSDNLIYELSDRINKDIFEEVFIKKGRISFEELTRRRDKNLIRSRFEILDL